MKGETQQGSLMIDIDECVDDGDVEKSHLTMLMVMMQTIGARWQILMKGEAQPGSLLINIDDNVDCDNDADGGDGSDGHHDHGHDNEMGG